MSMRHFKSQNKPQCQMMITYLWKSKSDISSSCMLNPNNYVPIYNKNSANNIRESNKRKEVIRQPRPASCTFGTNGGENGTLEGKQIYEKLKYERSCIQSI